MKKIFLSIALIGYLNLFAQNEVYEIRTYELFQYSNFKNFNTYFEDHFIPILNQKGINNIGVFKEVSEDLPRKIYVFIPFADMDTYRKARSLMASDAKIQKASAELSPVNRPIFNRYETSFTWLLTECPKWSNPMIKIAFLNCVPMKVIRKMLNKESQYVQRGRTGVI